MYKRVVLKNLSFRKGALRYYNDVDAIVHPTNLNPLDLYTERDLEIQKHASLHYHSDLFVYNLGGKLKAGEFYCVEGNEDSYFNNILFFFYDEDTSFAEVIYKTLTQFPGIEAFKEGGSILFILDEIWIQGRIREAVRDIEMAFYSAKESSDGNVLERYSEIILLCGQEGLYEPLKNSWKLIIQE